MLRFVKQIVWLLGVLVGCQSAFGFALIGPIPAANSPDDFETSVLAYNVGSDLSTPKDVKEEYRRNTPVMYYAVDDSFWEYFREQGVADVDNAMAMFNSVGKSSVLDINDYPEDSRRMNFRAANDGLYDLKSLIMILMAEQLGFLEPSRWVWTLHGRDPGNLCPSTAVYTVFQRNFTTTPVGVDTYPTSSYVNGVLYSYFINEVCTPPNPLAEAIEFPVDPLSSPYSAVADGISYEYNGLPIGGFYTSLTRDDVAALKYLLATNNLNNEASGFATTEFITNAPAAIQTQDLNALATAARTNDPNALIALFPGLTVASTVTNFFNFAITTNITETLVNSPLDPAGAAPSHPVYSTNYTTNLVTTYQHTFGNVITNTYASRGLVGIVTLGLTNAAPFSPAGTVVTNGLPTLKVVPMNGVFGDFFILPTNVCGAQILSNLLTTVTATTNLPTSTTGATTNSITFTPGSVTFATNHTIAYLPVTCPVDSIGVRGGVDRIVFIRRDYDSLLSRVWDPVTNDYTVTELNVTNRTIGLMHFRRYVHRPDFLFSAVDFAANNTFTYSNTLDNVTETITFSITGVGESLALRSLAFNQAGRPGNLAGPGTIEDGTALGTVFAINKLAPLFQNSFAAIGSFLVPNELTQSKLTGLASFDGTTNAPILYPNGTSLQELENLLIGPASTTPSLPNANIGLPYSAQLSAIGGQAPYTWALAPSSPGLPGGLNISASGKITGTPTGPASIYDFTLRLTDSAGVFRDVQYTITVF